MLENLELEKLIVLTEEDGNYTQSNNWSSGWCTESSQNSSYAGKVIISLIEMKTLI